MSSTKSIFGDNGYDEITTGPLTGNQWYAIKAVDGGDAEVDIINAQGDSSTGLTIVSGDVIYVTATSITVNSGVVHAYKKKIL